jgi:hypothetical protein
LKAGELLVRAAAGSGDDLGAPKTVHMRAKAARSRAGAPSMAPSGLRVRAAVAAAILAVAVVGAIVLAYHLGKDCGAWEARDRLDGRPKPRLCFSTP